MEFRVARAARALLEPALSAVEGAARRKHSWDDAVLKRAAREPHRQWPKLDTTHYPIHSASRRMVHAGRVRYPELRRVRLRYF